MVYNNIHGHSSDVHNSGFRYTADCSNQASVWTAQLIMTWAACTVNITLLQSAELLKVPL